MSSLLMCSLAAVLSITGGDNYLAGRARERGAHYHDAIAAYQSCAAAKGPLTPYAQIRVAMCLAASGNKAEAIDRYQSVLKDFPKGAWVRMAQALLASTLAREQRTQEAAVLYAKALSFEPKPWWVDAQESAAAKVLVSSPDTQEKGYAYFRKVVATTYLRDKRIDAARYLSTAPDLESRQCAAWGYIKSGECTDARTLLNGLLAESDDGSLVQLASMSASKTSLDLSGLKGAPKSPLAAASARLYLTCLARFFLTDDHTVSAALCDKLVDLWPDAEETGEALWWLANRLAKDGKTGDAIAQYKRLAKMCPKHNKADDALLALGDLYKKSGQPLEAARAYTQLGKRYPESKLACNALYVAGNLYSGLGKKEESIRCFEQAAACGVGNYYAHAALKRLHTMAKDKYPAGKELHVDGAQSPLSAFPLAADAPIKVPAKFAAAPRFERLIFFGMEGLEEAEWEAIEIGQTINKDPAAAAVYELLAEMGLSATAMDFADAFQWNKKGGKPAARHLRVDYPRAYWPYVSKIAQETNVDPYLILAVARQESTFRPALTSYAGARGVMQVMPGTASMIAKASGLKADNLDNPLQSLRLGARYIADMLKSSGGNIAYALASYNAGPGNCSKWRKQFGNKDLESFIESIPFNETRDYVKRVLANYAAYYSLY